MSCISARIGGWNNAGLINRAEQGAIQRCAAKSIKYKKDKWDGNGNVKVPACKAGLPGV
jgi:hypothetical protein